MTATTKRTVLVSGASIAGTAVAYWLNRHGFEVTVVEKAATVRGGGYPIDVRGTALDVAHRMGVLPRLREAHIQTRRLDFLTADGDTVASMDPRALAGSSDDDVELRRGDLVDILYRTVADDVEFRFDDSVATLREHPDGVDVTFHSGATRGFDLVIGADGLHSTTRELAFGPEQPFHHYLGYCFAGFTMPNDVGLSHEVQVWNTAGRGAARYAVRDSQDLHGILVFARPRPPHDTFRDPAAQRDLVAATFAEDGWEIPALLAAMRRADDLFFDVVSQIRLPRWHDGRVALVGDAAYAPSFLTGQGSSLALVGAYMLAGSLATQPDHATAFTAYERDTRGYVEHHQARIGSGDAALFPVTVEALARRNRRLRGLVAPPEPAVQRDEAPRSRHAALRLPAFATRPGF